jgi:hypothetical protein
MPPNSGSLQAMAFIAAAQCFGGAGQVDDIDGVLGREDEHAELHGRLFSFSSCQSANTPVRHCAQLNCTRDGE